MTAVRSLGVVVVGLGVGEQHVLAFARDTRSRVTAVCDLDRARAEQVASRLDGVTVAQDLEAALCDPDLDIVSIASYDDAHFAQVCRALAAGKHVFVEKPLCRTRDELRAVKAAWQAHGGNVKLQSNLVLRAAPLHQWLKKEIVKGTFGQLYAFDGDYLYGRVHKITHGWRKDVDDYSVLEGGGVHLVDLMLWLTGQRPAAVTAAANRICTEGTPFRYDDFAAATFRFPSGLIGRITANFGCVHRHQHVVRVFGTKATFIYDDAGARLHSTRDPDAEAERIGLSPLPATKGDLIPSFLDSVLTGSSMVPDTQHEFDLIAVCEAAHRAAGRRHECEIEYL